MRNNKNSSPRNSAKKASKESIDSLNRMLLSGLISKGRENEPLLARDFPTAVSPDTGFKFKSN